MSLTQCMWAHLHIPPLFKGGFHHSPVFTTNTRSYWQGGRLFCECVSKCLNPVVMKPLANAGDIKDTGLIPELGRFPGEGHGYPIQYSCLENPMDRRAWRATLHRVPENWTQWKWLSMHSTHALSLRITLYIGKMFLEIKQVKAITHTFFKWIFLKKE